MSIQDWQDVVARVMASGEKHPEVQLYFLMQRLEAHPEAIGAIADAVRDTGLWYQRQADMLEREGGLNVLPFNSGGAA